MRDESGKKFIQYLKSKTVDQDWTKKSKFETICKNFFNKLIENKDKLPEYKLIIENLSNTFAQHNWIENQKIRDIIRRFFNYLFDSKNQADSKMII